MSVRALILGASASLTVLWTSACGSREAASERLVVDDSAGVAVVTSTSPRLPEPVMVGGAPVMEVSPDFGDPERSLYRVGDATLLSDGTVVVGNAGTQELFFFSPEGGFEGAVGGQGQGPGELEQLFDLFRCGADRLVVEEVTRLSLIRGGDRGFERSVRIVGNLAAGRADLAGIRGDCSAALLTESDDDAMDTTGGIFAYPSTLYWADLDTGARDSLGTFGATEAFPWELRGRPMPIRLPYGRVASWDVHPEGVVLGMAEEPSWRILGEGGAVLRVVRWDAASQSLTDAEWAHHQRALEEALREHPEERAFQPPAGYLPRPHLKPAYARILADDVGRVWVQNYGLYGAFGPEPSSRWSVFTAAGEWLAEVQMPEGLEVLHLGDSTVVGATRDDLDRERVQLHRFRLP